MAQKRTPHQEFLHFYNLFEKMEIPYNQIDYSDCINNILDEQINKDSIPFFNNLGCAAGLYYIWKNDTSSYVGFSLDGHLPNISKSDLNVLMGKEKTSIIISPKEMNKTLIVEYRDRYYDYDLRVLRELLKNKYPVVSEYAEKEIFNKRKYYYPTAIMRKDVYRKFCIWLFSLLEDVPTYCSEKKSLYQNKYLEHLTKYLFTVYIEYNLSKLNPVFVEQFYECSELKDEDPLPKEGTLTDCAQKLINNGKPEKIGNLLQQYNNSITSNTDDEEYKCIEKLYRDYNRQRRYYRQTILDADPVIQNYIEKNKNTENKEMFFIGNRKPRVFFLKWNSFNFEDVLDAFQRAGFETDYLEIKDISYIDSPGNADIINTYLDNNKFDLAFTTNYLQSLSETCYTHSIPYLAWAYDSPTNLGDRSTIDYDTSNIFLFDSEEQYLFNQVNGHKRIHYLPLAVDCKRYDSIELSKDDIDKYSADISFVGGLYDTNINEYLKYLGDYQKGMINAITDCNVGKYGSFSLNDIINSCTGEWFGNKAFYKAVYEGEKRVRDQVEDDSSLILGRLSVLMHKMVTNKERLILISMLSNHFDFKLFSNKSHEVFKNVKECGVVSYYEEMPKVFKASKINLNITLKTIRNGIPLRCLDIMGNHGFLLSNYQKDFDDHFVDGENVALYYSLEEAFDKCKYYLTHDTERRAIAEKGYETVKNYYNYDQAIKKMLSTAELDYLIKD